MIYLTYPVPAYSYGQEALTVKKEIGKTKAGFWLVI